MPQQADAELCDNGIALDDPAVEAACAAPPRLDDWQTHRHVRRLDRELRRSLSGLIPNWDRGTKGLPPEGASNRIAIPDHSYEPSIQTAAPRAGWQPFAWLSVIVGVITLFVGLGTMTWSLAAERPDWWSPATRLTLGGQSLLILGLVLILVRLWRKRRGETGTLREDRAPSGRLESTPIH